MTMATKTIPRFVLVNNGDDVENVTKAILEKVEDPEWRMFYVAPDPHTVENDADGDVPPYEDGEVVQQAVLLCNEVRPEKSVAPIREYAYRLLKPFRSQWEIGGAEEIAEHFFGMAEVCKLF
jgi:hypothetical protein